MSDSTINIIIGLIGLLTNIVIFMTWWIRHSHTMAATRKQNSLDIEEVRHKNQMQENKNFKDEIDGLKKGIALMNRKLDEFRTRVEASVDALVVAEMKYTETQKKTDQYLSEFDSYKKWSESRFRDVDSKQQDFIKRLEDFGKVVLKP